MLKKEPSGKRQLLNCEHLEDRSMPSAQAVLSSGVLNVTGTGSDRIRIVLDGTNLDVYDGTSEIGTFANSAVTSITVTTSGGYNTVIVGPTVMQATTITGGAGGTNKFVGGGGTTNLMGGSGDNYLFGGEENNVFQGGGMLSKLLRVGPTDIIVPDPDNLVLQDSAEASTSFTPSSDPTLTATDVSTLLDRAAAASSNTGAIIAVVDRNGNILGVRVEDGVSTDITGNTTNLVFAVDGAVSLARTAAFFSSDQDELTSRTVQYISQSTITEREVDSNPDVADQNSTAYGPGYVAPVEIGGNFPPGILNTDDVDLFEIEQTNRDGLVVNGVPITNRFNAASQYLGTPAQTGSPQALYAPISYGVASGLMPNSQNRGIATLPGGVPIFMPNATTGSLQLMGGIGVFFPGTTGYATAENSALSSTYNPSQPDLSALAEWMAFAAVGGVAASLDGLPTAPIGSLSGIAPLTGVGLANAVVNLGGIQLPLFGGIGTEGLDSVINVGNAAGRGNPFEGTNLVVNGATAATLMAGVAAPSGWLVVPHSGDGITQTQVEQIVAQGLAQAEQTRSAIRIPNPVTNNLTIGTSTEGVFVIAVTDNDGNLVGLYDEPDATVFSIDVAVAKARNADYYANPSELQPQDQLQGIPAGTAFSARTFRYLAEPLFPEGINGSPPGPWSILNDPGTNPANGLESGPALPASAYTSVEGYASFHPDANFADPNNPQNQNGVVFFPGSAPLYAAKQPGSTAVLSGGLGVSGDGVNQDDVVTQSAEVGFLTPPNVLQADQVTYKGVRLPYQESSRNPNQG